MKNHSILFFAIIIFFSCQPKSNTIDPMAMQITLSQNWEGFIKKWEAEDAAGCAAFYTNDGINIGPESEIKKGREAIAEFYNFLFSNNTQSKYTHEIIDFDATDKHAIEQGRFKVEWVGNDSTEWTFNARSLTHWVKEEDGKWRVKRFIFNRPPQNQ